MNTFTLSVPDGSHFVVSLYRADGQAAAILRVQWWPKGTPHPHMRRTWSLVDSGGHCPREGRPRDALTEIGPYRLADWDGQRADLGGVQAELRAGPFGVSLSDAAGQPLTADLDPISYVYDARTGRISHTLSRRQDDHYYGFGEKSGPLDKHARYMRMRNTDAFGYDAETGDPLYKHVPFYITFTNGRAYGLFYDTPYDCSFDMGAEIDNYYGDYRVFRVEGGHLDYYLIGGGSIAEVVKAYTALTGRSPAVPKWTLGYLGNGMRYTDHPDAQTIPAEFVAKVRRFRMPCSGFHFGSGYTMAADKKRYVFTWAHDRIPGPSAMVGIFNDAGLPVIANIKPAMLTTHPRFAESRHFFIREARRDNPDLSIFWGGEGAHIDFTHPAAFDWWAENVQRQLFDYGISAAWNDNNEYNIRHDDARCYGFGEELPLAAARPIQTLLMAMSSYQATVTYWPERQPFLLSRAGAPGVQRYAHTWTGDNRTSWKTLKYNVPMGLGLSLSGFFNFGHDIGGFAGPTPEPELFLRWVQSGIFNPRFSINSWRQEGPEEAPWMHAEVIDQVREALRFRERLLPYLYSLLHIGEKEGIPPIVPTVYYFPNDPATYTQSFEYMMGPYLLVATVLEKGERVREVYLPAGTSWYDWHTGERYDGGQTIQVDAPLERYPFFVRAGTILPLADPDGERLYLFPPEGVGETVFKVYEGDGVARNSPPPRLIRIAATESEVRVSTGGLPFTLPAWERRRVVTA